MSLACHTRLSANGCVAIRRPRRSLTKTKSPISGASTFPRFACGGLSNSDGHRLASPILPLAAVRSMTSVLTCSGIDGAVRR
jgi:hypothetical protein